MKKTLYSSKSIKYVYVEFSEVLFKYMDLFDIHLLYTPLNLREVEKEWIRCINMKDKLVWCRYSIGGQDFIHSIDNFLFKIPEYYLELFDGLKIHEFKYREDLKNACGFMTKEDAELFG